MDTYRNKAKRAHRILDIAQAMAAKMEGWQVRNQIEGISLFFEGYAEPGYTDPECGIIATGNWNEITRYEGTTRHVVSDLPKRIGDMFEAMGIEIEWSDEWSSCCSCNKLVRSSADSYSWKPSYVLGEGELLCHECVKEDPEAYLESIEGDCDRCVTIDIDPEDHGYVRTDEDYETGFYPGQNDRPSEVAKKLRAAGIERFVFKLDNNSQFDSRWSVYVKEE